VWQGRDYHITMWEIATAVRRNTLATSILAHIRGRNLFSQTEANSDSHFGFNHWKDWKGSLEMSWGKVRVH